MKVRLVSIKEMNCVERGEEIKRLRKAIAKWVKIYQKGGNERCHEVDEELANIVGLSLYPSRKRKQMTAKIFHANCVHYIARECRMKRLIDDR